MSERDKNQGEGDKDAARNYHDSTEEFIESGKVSEKAEEAKNSTAREKEEMEQAVEKGRERAKT